MAPRLVRLLFIGLLAGVLAGCTGSGSAGGRTPTVAPSTTRGQVTAICPSGSDPDAAGPAHQARPEFSDESRASAVFDRQSGRIVLVDAKGGTWTFDVCTNTWAQVTTRGAGPPGTAYLVYDPYDDLTYAISEGGAFPTIRFYDVETSTWATVGPPRDAPRWEGPDPGFVMDPVDGVFYGYDRSLEHVWAYDIGANTWTEVTQREPRPPNDWWATAATFDPSVGRIVFYGLRPNDPAIRPPVDRARSESMAQTWTFDPGTGAWKLGSTRNHTGSSYSRTLAGTEMTYNEASHSAVLLDDGRVAAFAATANRWRTPQPGTGWPNLMRLDHGLVDDVVNGRVVVLGGRVPVGEDRLQDGTDVWAYDVAANTWTELVPPQPN